MSIVKNTSVEDERNRISKTSDGPLPIELVETIFESSSRLLEKFKHDQTHVPKKCISTQISENHETADCLEMAELQQSNRLVVEENIRLKAVLQDVTEANKRWQKYNHERQTYMQKLMDTIRELRNQIHSEKATESAFTCAATSSSNLPTCPPSITFEEVMEMQLKYEKLNDENLKLRKELDDRNRKLAKLTNELDKVNHDNKEHIELLEMQVQAHRDDWEAEKQEKKDIVERESQLQAKLREAKLTIKSLQRELGERDRDEIHICRCRSTGRPHTEPIISISTRHSSPAMYNIPPDNLIPRGSTLPPSRSHRYYYDEGFVIDGTKSKTDSHLSPETETLSSATHDKPSTTLSTSSSSSGYVDSTTSDSLSTTGRSGRTTATTKAATVIEGPDYVCPECSKVFPPGKHYDFVQHFEKCQRQYSGAMAAASD